MKRDRSQEYRPPPENACTPDEGLIDLALVDGESHYLYRNVQYYRGKVVWFSLQQGLRRADGDHVVARVDCCDGEVHRHVFTESEGEIERVSLVRIPLAGHAVVDGEFDRYLNEMLSSWEGRLREWRKT